MSDEFGWGPVAGTTSRRPTREGGFTCFEVAPECVEVKPAPESPGFDITGRYQDCDGFLTFHVNQAGNHVEAWVSHVLTAKDYQAIPKKKLLRLSGDVGSDEMFRLYAYGCPSESHGTLTRQEDDSLLLLDSGGNKLRLWKRSDDVTHSKVVMSKVGQTPELVAWEWAPLTEQQLAFLHELMMEPSLDQVLGQAFDANLNPVLRDGMARVAIREIEAHLGRALSPEAGWHLQDLPLVRFFGRGFLSGRTWTRDDNTRRFLDWLQVLVDRTPEGSGLSNDSPLRWVGVVKPTESTRTVHDYAISITATGASASGIGGLGVYPLVVVTVKRMTQPRWQASYLAIVFGCSAGAQFGADAGFKILESSGDAPRLVTGGLQRRFHGL